MSSNPCDFPGTGCSKSSDLNEAFADILRACTGREEKAAAGTESLQEHALSYILKEEMALNRKKKGCR